MGVVSHVTKKILFLNEIAIFIWKGWQVYNVLSEKV